VAAWPGVVAEELQVEAADEMDRAVAQVADCKHLGDLVGGDDRGRDGKREAPVAG
jgi:hypothetical protein